MDYEPREPLDPISSAVAKLIAYLTVIAGIIGGIGWLVEKLFVK